MKKRLKYIVIALAAIVLIGGVSMYMVCGFRNNIVNGPIIVDDTIPHAATFESKQLKLRTIESKNSLISNIYLIKIDSQIQIRFRYMSSIPFLHKNIFGGHQF